MSRVEHIRGRTWHGRRGVVRHAFAYRVDYVMLDPEAPVSAPRLFSRDRANLLAVHDRDHGGAPGRGRGPVWLREVLASQGISLPGLQIALLAQPRVLGHVFNPVSFWFCRDGQGLLRAVVAEVTNTFGDRHSYLCRHDDLAPIAPRDELRAQKVFHVSPFQPIEGDYRFTFDIGANAISIRIVLDTGEGGVIATLDRTRAPLTPQGMIGACLRRPFGSRRVLALIHWQALRLWLKGARYRTRPRPPADEVSR